MTMRSAASTKARAPCSARPSAELRAVPFKNTSERMMSLGDLCALVDGRVPLMIEVKSHFDGDRKLVTRMAEVLRTYPGPAAVMSFDPDQVLAMREIIPERPRGIIAQRSYDDDYWTKLTPAQRGGMLHLRHAFRTRPHFVSFWVNAVAGAGALDRPPYFRPAAADLDRAHAGAARTGGALCRPDDLRRFRAGNLMRAACS